MLKVGKSKNAKPGSSFLTPNRDSEINWNFQPLNKRTEIVCTIT
jgi:hypothetical protein